MHSCYFVIYAFLKLLYCYINCLIHSCYFAINAILLLFNYIVCYNVVKVRLHMFLLG